MAEQSNLNYNLKIGAALSVVVSLIVISQIFFEKYLGTSYLAWYIDAGPFIGLATGVFAAAWGEMDRNSGLVSSNPLDYCGACVQLIGLPTEVFGLQRTTTTPFMDRLAGIPMIFVFLFSALAWLVFIAPLQYFIFLLCGAPSRVALKASGKVRARWETGNQLRTKPVPSDTAIKTGEWDASMKDKPVTLASGFSAAVFFGLGHVPFVEEFLKQSIA